ncbi:hypothetical protein D3C76_1144570 [compost metagenome]
MVLGQLVKSSTAPQITTAVARPDADSAVSFQQQRHHSAADNAGMIVGDGKLLAQSSVGPAQALAHRFRTFSQVPVQRQFRQVGNDQLAGNVTPRVATHAVGHRPHPLLWVVEKSILIPWPGLARVRARSAVPGAGLHQSCTGRRNVRSTLMSKGFGVRWLVSR